MTAVQTTDARLEGVNHLAVAVADARLVASCASSCRLVTIGISADDELPILGASATMLSAPEALVADATRVYVLSGNTIRSYSNAVIPVLTTSVSKRHNNNRWIDLVGSAYVLYADGEEIITATRAGLVTVSRSVSGIGRIWSGVYDAASGYAFVFAEDYADCAIFRVDANNGTLTLTNIISLPNSAPIEAAVIAGTNLHFITRVGARLQTWDITTPEEPVIVSSSIVPTKELFGIAAVADDKVLLITAEVIKKYNDEFDFSACGNPLFHSFRIFVPSPHPGRIWSSTRQFVWDTDPSDYTGLVEELTLAVYAGVNQTEPLASSVNLIGTVTDTAISPPTVTYLWTKVSGPGTVVFGDDTALSTTMDGSVAGAYHIRLTATDGIRISADTIEVVLTPGIIGVSFDVPPEPHYVSLPVTITVTIDSRPEVGNDHTIVFTAPFGLTIQSGGALVFTHSDYAPRDVVVLVDDSPTEDSFDLEYSLTSVFEGPDVGTITINSTVPVSEAPNIPVVRRVLGGAHIGNIYTAALRQPDHNFPAAGIGFVEANDLRQPTRNLSTCLIL